VTRQDLQHFDEVVAQLPALLKELQSAAKHRVADHPSVPNTPGIYVFTRSDRPIYVGQSRKLRNRLRQHTGAKNGHNQASFAFNIAKRDAAAAGVDIKRFRKALEADKDFTEHFDAARAQVAAMDVQFVAVPDPITRTMFEMYAALALDTAEFNSFETH
jgi:predicted GIY-YIG superfamily endonuclease